MVSVAGESVDILPQGVNGGSNERVTILPRIGGYSGATFFEGIASRPKAGGASRQPVQS